MFIIFLRFSDNKSHAKNFMQAHNDWITEHVNSGVFLMVGTLEPKQGGCILANTENRETIEAIITQDPFVTENIVTAEILEISPSKVNERLNFLLA